MQEIKIKKIKPMFTALVTTAERYTEPKFIPGTKLLDATQNKTGLKEYQHVLAVGDQVRNVHVGDLVCINPQRYAVRKYAKDNSIKDDMEETYRNQVVEYAFNMVRLDGNDCLLLNENDIDFVIEEYEEVEA